MAVDAGREDVEERLDVPLEPDLPPHLGEVLPPHATVLRVVQEQVGQLSSLLHEVGIREPVDLVLEPGPVEQLAQHLTGVVEAERLVEVAGDQVMLRGVRPLPGDAPGARGRPEGGRSFAFMNPHAFIPSLWREESDSSQEVLRPMGPSLPPVL